tara:strand:+ start:682 stop:861 length:180 start_codon:yes stop_codon:yes gene_type:complete
MKTYRTIKKVLKYHIEKNVLSLWTWQKGSEEEFKCIYKSYSGADRIYTPEQLLKKLEQC